MKARGRESGFIRRARRLGFTTAEARDLSSARWLEGACGAFQAMIQQKRRALRRRLASLEARDMELTALLVDCWKHEPVGPCPVRWDFRSAGQNGAKGTAATPASARCARGPR